MSTERDALQELLDDYPVRSVYGSEIHARAKAALATLFESAAPVAQAEDEMSRAEVDAIVYRCRQSGDDSTYAIVKAALASRPQAAPTGSDARDAARYRWLRGRPLGPLRGSEFLTGICIDVWADDGSGEQLRETEADAAIDAARSQDHGREHG